MAGRMTSIAMAAGLLLTASATGTEPADDTAALLQLVPADLPSAIVVKNPQHLDRMVTSWLKQLDPHSLGWGLFEDLRGDLPIGEWIDLTRPIAIALGGTGKDQPPILWAHVPDFDDHMGRLERAVREDDLWRIALPDGKELFARRRGEYVVAAMSMASLEQGSKLDRTLADAFRDRVDLMGSRDALVHLNMARLHDPAADLVAELTALGPLVTMLAEQQVGSGIVGLAAVTGAWLAGVEAVLDQAESVDLFVGIDGQAMTVTILARFNDGTIQQYLSAGKPDPRPLLTGIEARPYFLAVGARLPDHEASPVLHPVVERTVARLAERTSEPPAGTPADSSEQASAAAEMLRALAGGVKGADCVMTMSPDGVRMWADLVGPDPQSLGKDITALLTAENPILRKLRGGAALERLGPRTLGETVIDEFALRPLPPPNVEGESGGRIRLGMGVGGERLRLCLGTEIDVNGRFGLTVSRPFAQGDYTREALAALPADANVVALIDPARLMPLISRLQGTKSADALAPGPPIAISCTLVGNPARIDFHVPLRALERLGHAMHPSERL